MLGEGQIQLLEQAMNRVIDRADTVLTGKIEELRELLNGISLSTTSVVNAKQIRKPE